MFFSLLLPRIRNVLAQEVTAQAEERKEGQLYNAPASRVRICRGLRADERQAEDEKQAKHQVKDFCSRCLHGYLSLLIVIFPPSALRELHQYLRPVRRP